METSEKEGTKVIPEVASATENTSSTIPTTNTKEKDAQQIVTNKTTSKMRELSLKAKEFVPGSMNAPTFSKNVLEESKDGHIKKEATVGSSANISGKTKTKNKLKIKYSDNLTISLKDQLINILHSSNICRDTFLNKYIDVRCINGRVYNWISIEIVSKHPKLMKISNDQLKIISMINEILVQEANEIGPSSSLEKSERQTGKIAVSPDGGWVCLDEYLLSTELYQGVNKKNKNERYQSQVNEYGNHKRHGSAELSGAYYPMDTHGMQSSSHYNLPLSMPLHGIETTSMYTSNASIHQNMLMTPLPPYHASGGLVANNFHFGKNEEYSKASNNHNLDGTVSTNKRNKNKSTPAIGIKNKDNENDTPISVPHYNSVEVINLQKGMPEEEIIKIFTKFGKVRRVTLPMSYKVDTVPSSSSSPSSIQTDKDILECKGENVNGQENKDATVLKDEDIQKLKNVDENQTTDEKVEGENEKAKSHSKLNEVSLTEENLDKPNIGVLIHYVEETHQIENGQPDQSNGQKYKQQHPHVEYEEILSALKCVDFYNKRKPREGFGSNWRSPMKISFCNGVTAKEVDKYLRKIGILGNKNMEQNNKMESVTDFLKKRKQYLPPEGKYMGIIISIDKATRKVIVRRDDIKRRYGYNQKKKNQQQMVFEYIAKDIPILDTFEVNQKVEFHLKHEEVKVEEDIQDYQAVIDGDLVVKTKVEVMHEAVSTASSGQPLRGSNPRQMVTNRSATGPDGTIGFTNIVRTITCRWNRANTEEK